MSGDPRGAEATRYGDRKIAETQAHAVVEKSVVEQIGGVLRELVSAAKSNPVMGCVLAVVVADMLAQARVIQPRTEAFIFSIVGVAFGVTISLEVVEGIGAVISALDPFKSGGTTAPDPSKLIAPSAQTLVENPPPAAGGASGGATSGLVASLLTRVPPI